MFGSNFNGSIFHFLLESKPKQFFDKTEGGSCDRPAVLSHHEVHLYGPDLATA